jgi:hypothetical protein
MDLPRFRGRVWILATLDENPGARPGVHTTDLDRLCTEGPYNPSRSNSGAPEALNVWPCN